MPTISRERDLDAPAATVWRLLADPARLAEWWPGVQRVEEVTDTAWTAVLASERSTRPVRADYSLVERRGEDLFAWRHEVDESPFERIFADSVTTATLSAGPGGTRVRLTAELELRGFSRFGGFQIRRATARQLEGALAGLAHATGEGGD